MKILVIHGPNLNLLGEREPEIYGKQSLAQIDALLAEHGREMDIEVESFQSNHEGAIIDSIQGAAADGVAAIVINPGAYTHTSLAIADAIRAVKTPVVEVHLSNLYARGIERATSVTASACRGIVSGFAWPVICWASKPRGRSRSRRGESEPPRSPRASGDAERGANTLPRLSGGAGPTAVRRQSL
jgi:3-dehydroquinate dehydratase-2